MINYSGRWDILQATQQLIDAGVSPVTEEAMREALCFADLPEPDLFVRTSGEVRISNFMLWQLAYTEMYFTDVLWPDFQEQAFIEALASFGNRERRFGLTGEQIKE